MAEVCYFRESEFGPMRCEAVPHQPNIVMPTIELAKEVLDAVGTCLCGHDETCSVCTRSDKQHSIEKKCRKLLREAGCGIAFPHKFKYTSICRICRYCGIVKIP